MNPLINEKFLNIPPFISTQWDEVKFIHLQETTLVVEMKQGVAVRIPNLSQEMIEVIFSAHSLYLKKQETAPSQHIVEHARIQITPIRLGGSANPAFEQFNSSMQHNPELAQAPDFPPEVLQKIAAIAKVVMPNHPVQLPKAEPHCNCPHCQIARAIQVGVEGEVESIEDRAVEYEEFVADDELKFEQWSILSKENNLYEVSNKLDPHEQYLVCLGERVGCNCGKEGCEHIIAVLNSYS